jgi:hypothetical protein
MFPVAQAIAKIIPMHVTTLDFSSFAQPESASLIFPKGSKQSHFKTISKRVRRARKQFALAI